MMTEERLRSKLIHEVMVMAYEEGIQEGRKQALEEIRGMAKSERGSRQTYKQIDLNHMQEPFITVDDIPLDEE